MEPNFRKSNKELNNTTNSLKTNIFWTMNQGIYLGTPKKPKP